MILQPGVLALLTGEGVVLYFVAVSAVLGLGVLQHWDYQSSSARQLVLERRTYLLSTVTGYAVGFTALSLFLFLYVADDLHPLLVGAMCATGVLNADPLGWYALAAKGVLLLVGGGWVLLNRLDQQAEDYPLVRLKYALLLVLAPLVVADAVLEFRFFRGIRPDVITSCCGSLFTFRGGPLASSLVSLPPLPSLWLLAGVGGAQLLTGALSLRCDSRALRLAYGALSALLLPVGIAAVIAAVAPYIYELPNHHCPFDVLQRGYYFVGYPLFASLIASGFFGSMTGLFEPLRRRPTLAPALARAQARWTRWSLLGLVVFAAVVAWAVASSGLSLTR